MKNKSIFLPLSILALALVGCNSASSNNGKKGTSSGSDSYSTSGAPTSANSSSSSDSSSSDASSSSSHSPNDDLVPDVPYTPSGDMHDWTNPSTVEGDFSILNDSSEASGFIVSGSTYTINTAGTYTLSGELNGNINIEVGSSDTVELDLKGVKITSSSYAPIFAKTADKLKVKAVKNTSNFIIDNRPNKTVDSDDQGEGAIAAKCDTHLIGSGELQVEGNYNNGVHTSKDLKIKNLTLKSFGHQHAIRGGNSITVFNESTYIEAIGQTGDGFKSNDAGITSKGKQKGTITFTGGTSIVNCYNDAVDAAYNVEISVGTDEDSGEPTVPTLHLYSGSYATLTKSTSKASTISPHGINARNEVNISSGKLYIEASGDGIHSNKEALTDSDDVETGVMGLGDINISGGSMTIKANDDGIHADTNLNISGGVIDVIQSYEGIEGFYVTISGGKTTTIASNDGANAGGKNNTGTPSFTVTGGYLEINVSPDGDIDGIDSNGTYTQTGGIVITKGPNDKNMSALDHQGTANISGGTIIVLGAIEGQSGGGGGGGGWWSADRGPGGGMPGSGEVTISSNMQTYSLSLHAKGNHIITINEESYTFTNSYAYGKTTCYSDVAVTGY